MKRSTTFISLVVLLHLFVFDGAVLILFSEALVDLMVIIFYNVIWLLIACILWIDSFTSSRT